MTDTALTALLAAIPATIGSIGALIVVIRQGKRQSDKIQEVKEIVDGPLSVALKSNAELAAKIAELTGDHDDLKVAVSAKAVQENREAGKGLPTIPDTSIT